MWASAFSTSATVARAQVALWRHLRGPWAELRTPGDCRRLSSPTLRGLDPFLGFPGAPGADWRKRIWTGIGWTRLPQTGLVSCIQSETRVGLFMERKRGTTEYVRGTIACLRYFAPSAILNDAQY
ncbi:hypothetical protein PR003_g4975 [Phytophthora rubi]|uniref:Uncharacterized protein n=1 Tax=Phytophthora rubi TaxID=129364 RepID=A0A6A3NYL8_9STRA|nr:hypothetical protein PR002_g4931 [Phytophthora rubi]KAE9046138.1 hypothetical protein PR001_g4688 [Phytophthora rubi]KAE9351254.1 hypothetical protein PR003_g4975 [Phytophthora rubi]